MGIGAPRAGPDVGDASSGHRSFAARFAGALRLDASVFEEVEHDARALPQAALVVALAGLARGIEVLSEQGWIGAAASLVAAFVLWLAVTAAVTAIGVRMLHYTSGFLELLRTLGFAAAPLVALVICALPLGVLGTALSLLVHAVAVGALVVAIRQALDTDTIRALIVCAGAIVLGLVLLSLLGVCYGDPRPNEPGWAATAAARRGGPRRGFMPSSAAGRSSSRRAVSPASRRSRAPR